MLRASLSSLRPLRLFLLRSRLGLGQVGVKILQISRQVLLCFGRWLSGISSSVPSSFSISSLEGLAMGGAFHFFLHVTLSTTFPVPRHLFTHEVHEGDGPEPVGVEVPVSSHLWLGTSPLFATTNVDRELPVVRCSLTISHQSR